MKSTFSKTFIALKPISSRLPIGVDIKYKPISRLFIFLLFTIIISCSPQNYLARDDKPIIKIAKPDDSDDNVMSTEEKIFDPDDNVISTEEKTFISVKKLEFGNKKIINEVEVLLPKTANQNITIDFVNAFELSLYKKNIKNIQLNINQYSNKKDLDNIISQKASPGKIFIGPLTSDDAENIKEECHKGILFFSFAFNRKHAGECVFLINFFPEDDLIALFNNFKLNSKIVLLYPENDYGYYVNSIIDSIATKSNSIITNRASYKEDLSNASEAIKELSKFELRKYELERQKTILKTKKDKESIKALKKIEKFETSGVVDFTHILIPDYSIRLLQIAALLPFYDIDPNKVKFVGTGVWDNKAFFNEPSLQGSIFPGVSLNKRRKFIYDYYSNYNKKPTRTITIPYDLVSILEYIINNNLILEDVHKLLNDQSTTFEGIDGKFSFKNNIIFRELEILKISNGEANLIKGSQ